jgi:hypothetical protein
MRASALKYECVTRLTKYMKENSTTSSAMVTNEAMSYFDII